MNEHLKLFSSDADRQTFEASNAYERPYCSKVDNNSHYNVLIVGTIVNPSIGQVNVQNGDYFDNISVTKGLLIGDPDSTHTTCNINFLCFPFNITFEELKYNLKDYKITCIGFADDMTYNIPDEEIINNDGTLNGRNYAPKLDFKKYNTNTIITANRPFWIVINHNRSEEQLVNFTFTFKNKTISISNNLTAEQLHNKPGWYFVGAPFRINPSTLGTNPLEQVIIVSRVNGKGGLYRSGNKSPNIATCSGWIEYRGSFPIVENENNNN